MNRRTFLKTAGASIASVAALGTAMPTVSAFDVPHISTRDHFDDSGNLTSGHGTFDYETSGNVPGVDVGCAGDVTQMQGGSPRL
jgi:hypothetical protein